MSVFYEKVMIFILLVAAFGLLFTELMRQRIVQRVVRDMQKNIHETSRKNLLQNRKNLADMEKTGRIWLFFEHNLWYSGIKRRFPVFTVEIFISLNACIMSLIFIIALTFLKISLAVLAVCVFVFAEVIVISAMKAKNLRTVNENLMKFLDFLGNYSVIEGEITAILGQIGKYLDEPLRGVLEECCYEAQITGDSSTALLEMAERVEHPMFKEIVRNMEINIRYITDFTTLVSGSRRSVRDYMKNIQEKKSMMREGFINMLLLLIMSVFSLVVVDGLVPSSIWDILIFTLPGKIALGVVCFIICLFAGQVYTNRR